MSNVNQTNNPQSSQSGTGTDNLAKTVTQIAVGAAILGGVCYLAKTNPHINKLAKEGVDAGGNVLSQKAAGVIDTAEKFVVDNAPNVSGEAKTQTQDIISQAADAIKKFIS